MKSRRVVQWVAGAGATVVLAVAAMAAMHAQAEPNQPPPAHQGRGGGRGGGPFGGGPMGPGGLLPRVANLTDAQRQQIRSIADSHKAETQPMMEQLRASQTALEDAIVASPIDEATIRLRSAEVSNAEADLAVARARITAQVMAVLTPDQVKELQARREQMKQRRQNGPPARR